jgi:hypothetical protein
MNSLKPSSTVTSATYSSEEEEYEGPKVVANVQGAKLKAMLNNLKK